MREAGDSPLLVGFRVGFATLMVVVALELGLGTVFALSGLLFLGLQFGMPLLWVVVLLPIVLPFALGLNAGLRAARSSARSHTGRTVPQEGSERRGAR